MELLLQDSTKTNEFDETLTLQAEYIVSSTPCILFTPNEWKLFEARLLPLLTGTALQVCASSLFSSFSSSTNSLAVLSSKGSRTPCQS
jgi:hypothetical protein